MSQHDLVSGDGRVSPNGVDVARSHFDSKTRALRKGDVLVLETGELSMIASAVRRSVSHVHRMIKGERVSPHLRIAIENVTGWPLSLTRLPAAQRTAA